MTDVPDIIKSRVRAFLLSCTNHKEPLHTFEANYGKLYKKLNLRELGFNSLQSFMSAIPDAVSIRREGNMMMLVGIPTEQNKHIVEMIEKQKKPKKKPTRDSMVLPRFQAGGGRVPPIYMPLFKIAYPNASARPYRPPQTRFNSKPSPSFTAYRPRPSPSISAPPRAALLSNPPPPRKPPSPVKSANVQDRLGRLSVHERLGPPQAASGLEKARRRVEAAREAAQKEKEMAAQRSFAQQQQQQKQQQLQQQQRQQQQQQLKSSRRIIADISEPLEIRIDGDSHQRIVSLKSPEENNKETRVIVLHDSPVSNDSPVPAVIEVDSDGASDESFEFPVDADFLRMLVFYVISEADTDRNWVSASGLGSRMRRRLAKAGVETPPAIAESILKFMQYEWKDMFDAVDERGDCFHLNTPFKFCPTFRLAYSANVEPLEPQLVPSLNETLSARIVHVEAPAIFVRLCNEQSEEILAAIGDELASEYLSSEPGPDEVFTYRKNEMCAVSVETTGGQRLWRRGRVEAFTLLGDELDEQTSELTAFLKVFLVDSGQVVNVRAGDVRPLPKRLFATQALAYRCVFQGATLENPEAFDRMMRKYVDEKVELQVHGEQSADELMTLQVRIQADSYLLDELVYANVARRVTCADPDPPSFPPDACIPVSWLAWREQCRAVLVKLNHPEQQRRLFELEVKLSEAVAKEPRAARLLANNSYVWRRPSELCRRVRCISAPADGPIQVFCLDHGCKCIVTANTDLCLPTSAALKSLWSGTPYFTAKLRLALIPPDAGEVDVVRQCDSLKKDIQGLCERNSVFVARHETLISETPSFMLYPVDDNPLYGSLNCRLLHLLVDMRVWASKQSFRARIRPLPEVDCFLGIPNAQCLVARFDAPDCRPNLEAHGREFRYLQRCCLDFTAKGGDSVMCRLSDLPENTLVNKNTKLVYRQLDATANSSLMCRVNLLEDYVAGCGATVVSVTPFDDPLLSSQMDTAPPDLLFTVPVECFGARPLERFSDDLEPKELELFCELLQNLPAVDQLAITISPTPLPTNSQETVEAEFTAITSVVQRQFPMINLRTE